MSEPSQRPDGAYVSVDPGMLSGSPCVADTRVPVDHVVRIAWCDGVDAAAASYGVTRAQVLAACWFVAVYGVEDIGTLGVSGWRTLRGPGPGWRYRWGVWSRTQHPAMWEGRWDDVADPPTKETP